MNTKPSNPGDDQLGPILRQARPAADLPPGFQQQVWQRIEKLDTRPATFLDWLAKLLTVPRTAVAALAVVIILFGTIGAVRGFRTGETTARDRYVASVDPAYNQH